MLNPTFTPATEAVVDDTLDDMDEDGDGKVSLLEYLGDFVDDEDENEKGE